MGELSSICAVLVGWDFLGLTRASVRACARPTKIMRVHYSKATRCFLCLPADYFNYTGSLVNLSRSLSANCLHIYYDCNSCKWWYAVQYGPRCMTALVCAFFSLALFLPSLSLHSWPPEWHFIHWLHPWHREIGRERRRERERAFAFTFRFTNGNALNYVCLTIKIR